MAHTCTCVDIIHDILVIELYAQFLPTPMAHSAYTCMTPYMVRYFGYTYGICTCVNIIHDILLTTMAHGLGRVLPFQFTVDPYHLVCIVR